MKKLTYQYPKSSFISIEKDMGTIIDMMLKDNRLKKMLYYTTKDCLSKENLDDDQTQELITNYYIRMIPKVTIDKEVLNYIIISFDNFTPNMTNPYYRDNSLTFDIICHMDQWELGDFQLRPYKIAAELDTLFNNRHLSGIGLLEFIGASQILLNEEFAGISLRYQAIHADDDQKNSPNEIDQEDMDANFDAIFNNSEISLDDLLDG